MSKSKERSFLAEPGGKLLWVLLAVIVFVFAWWPTDIYFYEISLVGWLMFGSLFIWLLLTIIYVRWMESIEDETLDEKDEKENDIA
ncbi:hypothetical protein HUG15_20550 [Salicibibacter cibarius]|uniref:Uncharacterized protein n=1 Tax=Salicibibacter cibarius TaxID=2743000 RepID=A0A7T6Z6K3_9BACI|nr:hypothetical protein [Salicibibacter cibarius]QQK77738.1 hypothetical protein HUG15_20550 [Salicibibacter cibarius]